MLGTKIKSFIDAVKTDKPGFISRKVLKDFILNGPIDIDPDVTEIVDSLFDLSFLIQGGQPGYISKNELSELFEVAKVFNARIWKYINTLILKMM